jgi:hypothetical protein
MSQRNKYWDAIIEQYKVSGLSQPAFCKQNELSYNQFQYRWYLHKRMEKAKVGALDKSSSFSDFEPVTISIAEHMLHKDTYVTELMINLPNRISCAVKMDSRTNGFATLLKQLVALC